LSGSEEVLFVFRAAVPPGACAIYVIEFCGLRDAFQKLISPPTGTGGECRSRTPGRLGRQSQERRSVRAS
jgi:hypothetical protein